MSKRNHTLLNEATVRRFMKYANLETTLVENFMDRVVSEDDDEGLEPDAEMDIGPADGAPAEMELGLEPEAELEAPAAPVVDEEVVEDLVSSIVAAISDVTGVEVGVEGEGASAEMPADLEGGDDLVAAEPEAVAEVPAEEEEEAFLPAGNRNEDKDLQEVDVVDDEELTEAVLRRVVERLLKNRK